MNDERTTKRVVIALTATFHGDYIDADSVTAELEGWIDSGLDDRDDLRGWSVVPVSVVEIQGDPDGYDS